MINTLLLIYYMIFSIHNSITLLGFNRTFIASQYFFSINYVFILNNLYNFALRNTSLIKRLNVFFKQQKRYTLYFKYDF